MQLLEYFWRFPTLNSKVSKACPWELLCSSLGLSGGLSKQEDIHHDLRGSGYQREPSKMRAPAAVEAGPYSNFEAFTGYWARGVTLGLHQHSGTKIGPLSCCKLPANLVSAHTCDLALWLSAGSPFAISVITNETLYMQLVKRIEVYIQPRSITDLGKTSSTNVNFGEHAGGGIFGSLKVAEGKKANATSFPEGQAALFLMIRVSLAPSRSHFREQSRLEKQNG
ncbi:hypothetical protein V8F06_008989 [Rhypophila decipiens]